VSLLSRFLYWTVMAILAIPGIIGLMVGLMIAAVCVLAFFLSFAVILLGCVPFIWWCALWESGQSHQLLAKLRSLKQQPHE